MSIVLRTAFVTIWFTVAALASENLRPLKDDADAKIWLENCSATIASPSRGAERNRIIGQVSMFDTACRSADVLP